MTPEEYDNWEQGKLDEREAKWEEEIAKLEQLRRDIRAWQRSFCVLCFALLVVIAAWVQLLRGSYLSGALLLAASFLLLQIGKRLQPRKDQQL